MEDNPDWWSSPTSEEEWQTRIEEAEKRRAKQYADLEGRWTKRNAVLAEFGDDSDKRSEAIWRERKQTKTTLQALADKYGVTPSRIYQIVAKRDWKIQKEKNHGG
jgi:DNA-directed RNA polymerase sigma subunit (sigma70/sigma32)